MRQPNRFLQQHELRIVLGSQSSYIQTHLWGRTGTLRPTAECSSPLCSAAARWSRAWSLLAGAVRVCGSEKTESFLGHRG